MKSATNMFPFEYATKNSILCDWFKLKHEKGIKKEEDIVKYDIYPRHRVFNKFLPNKINKVAMH